MILRRDPACSIGFRCDSLSMRPSEDVWWQHSTVNLSISLVFGFRSSVH
jgi:hypothetical protein